MPKFVPKLNNPSYADRILVRGLAIKSTVDVWIERKSVDGDIRSPAAGWFIRSGNGHHIKLKDDLINAAREALQNFPGFSYDLTTFDSVLDFVTVSRKRVLAARTAANLSQEEAAALVSAAHRTWQDWEYGVRPMPQAKWDLLELRLEALKAKAPAA